MRKFALFLSFAIIFTMNALAMGKCRADDAYDPMLGPRNPRPGAEMYLKARADIPEAEKAALLDGRVVTPDILKKLAAAPTREVRSLVAGNFSTPPDLLRQLARDPESGVRQYVASNPSAPMELLQQLSQDANENVQWSVAHNPVWTNRHNKGATSHNLMGF